MTLSSMKLLLHNTVINRRSPNAKNLNPKEKYMHFQDLQSLILKGNYHEKFYVLCTVRRLFLVVFRPLICSALCLTMVCLLIVLIKIIKIIIIIQINLETKTITCQFSLVAKLAHIICIKME